MSLILTITLGLGVSYAVTILIFLSGLLIRPMGKNKSMPRVSVVIAARNEEHNIGVILNDLVHQTFPKHLYEIIIANDGSSDKTAELVSDLARRHSNVKLLEIRNIPSHFSPKKYALQRAVQASTGEIILTTDADCRVGPNWIETMVSYFAPNVGFVIGFSQFGYKWEEQSFLERFQAIDYLMLMGVTAATCNLGFPLAASGQNLGFRREAFDAVNGYKSIARRISGDDVLLLQLIRRNTTYRVVFAANLLAFAATKPMSSLRELVQQRKRWASNGSYQLYLNLPFFLYLLIVFLFNIFIALSLLSLVIWPQQMEIVAYCLGAKAILEFGVALASGVYFNRKDLLKHFLPWFFLQIPYVLLIGTLGTFGHFKWKERTHSATLPHRSAR